jgi:hypothetical protein
MDELAPLLDHPTQVRLREVAIGTAYPQSEKLRDESLAVLALLGRQSEDLRGATLSIMPFGLREELAGHRLAAAKDATRIAWDLTSEGTEVARALAASLPKPDPAELQEAEEALAKLLADVQEELGPLE